MEWLTDSPWLAWIAIALILAAIEAATVDFVFVMLAGGALAGALTAGLGGGLAAQVIIAVAVATSSRARWTTGSGRAAWSDARPA